MSDLPKRVEISEEGPREGFQSEKKVIPVVDKVRLIEALADTGLRHIACVSYVNPKRVPTMADADEVASRIHQKPGIEYSALWLNQQGLERALRGPLHVDGGVRVTASDTFSRKNIGKSVPDAMVEQRLSLKTFKERGSRVGHHPRRLRLQLRRRAFDRADPATRPACARRGRTGGIHAQGHQAHRRHGLGDAALGRAAGGRHPLEMARARDRPASARYARHRQAAAYAGLRLGVTKFDASVAGLGGCPFAATDGAAGNICTEDFAFLCEEMGVETGLDIDRLIEVARLAEEVVGRPLPGHLMRGRHAQGPPSRRWRHECRDDDPDSTYVDVPSIPWQPTRFPGIEAKTLMANNTGMSTVLMRWAPGAWLPHHEHVAMEQTFVLEGSFADHAGVCRAATMSGVARAAATTPGPTKAAWCWPSSCSPTSSSIDALHIPPPPLGEEARRGGDDGCPPSPNLSP